MGYAIEVNSVNYETEVIAKSYEKPVLVDFFATWCGPCQMLKPLLEKLQKEYDFILAKIDIDQNNDLASQYGVEGVPDVRIVIQGQMFPGFVGALPETELRQFLANCGLKSELELKLDAVKIAKQNGNLSQVKQIFDQLFTLYPDHPLIAIEAAKFLLTLNQPETAEKMLDTIDPQNRNDYNQAQAIKTLINLTKVPATETNLEPRFNQAIEATFQEDYETALEIFLEIVETSRKYKEDGARKAMVAIFNLLGEQDSLTKTYQQKLMLTLY
jgi:putative thioredoxin